MKRFLWTISLSLMSFVAISAQSGIDQTAVQLAAQMVPGWNLGNTMEVPKNSLSAETSWQSTKTTQAIIDFVKAQGFRSVRIPCSWVAHFNSGTTTINASWMARVKEVVDYCINDGLYVVLNDHWDNGWLEDNIHVTDAATVQANKEKLSAVWTQVAETFKDYDEHLLFAGLNEPDKDLDPNNWTAAIMNNLVAYEQTFIDAVRATGGNNAKRVLVIQGPKTDINTTVKTTYTNNLPVDNIDNKLMMEIHYYEPWQFWGMEKDESWGKVFYYWGSGNHLSGSTHNATHSEEAYVRSQLQKMKTNFVDKGMPVIIGEYGANWRNISSVSGESQEKHNASIKAFYKTINQVAIEMGMVPMAWDINAPNQNGTKGIMTLIKRADCTIFNQYAMEGIKEAVASSTGIKGVTQFENGANDAIFDLCGRQIMASDSDCQLASLPSGIYIVKGKKVIVRR